MPLSKNTGFRVKRVMLNQVILTCDVCGETHTVNIKIINENGTVLKFGYPENE